jgi:hypothetical protein
MKKKIIEKEEPRGGAGEAVGAAVAQGGGGIAMCPPHVLVAVRQFFRRGCGSYSRNDRRQTNDNQKLTKGGFQQGGLNFAPLPPPLPKDTICH